MERGDFATADPAERDTSRIKKRTLALLGPLALTLLSASSTLLFCRAAIAEGPNGDLGEAWLPPRPYPITERRDPCAAFAPNKRAFFGDLHVHTARSQDASTQDTRVSPRDAYRFARGAELGIQPFDSSDQALRRVKLDRPLDFAAVTDHAEQLGEVLICNTPHLTGYDALACRLYRNFPRTSFFVMNARYSLFESRWGFCGEGGEICLAAAGVVWKEHQDAAEAFYDRSPACAFTSFVAYEWTAAVKAGGHLHRNVVFRNERVPELPISVMETSARAIELWRRLDRECRDGAPGCEAITIPHNSNWGAGSTFTSAETLGAEIGPDEAALRARYDRLVEIIQHKGESECALSPGVTDEGCAFEKAPNTFGGGGQDFAPINFARDALKRGLALEGELGVNPLAFGQIGSTDTHLGTPGLVAERGHPGHGGAGKPGNTLFDEPGLVDFTSLNPGGLAVLWAEENTRDALFEAMRRREAYATSGTRPELRFFGGWAYPLGRADSDAEAPPDTVSTTSSGASEDAQAPDPAGACAAEDLAAVGYAGGVPMGGELTALTNETAAPRFLVAAARDPHPTGGDLERLEIVKGWLEGGERRERVYTIAGGENGASVDVDTCERRGSGAKQLCRVWRDPDFDPQAAAFYYARLRENPSCRWTQWACVDAGVRCDDRSSVPDGYESCCEPTLDKTIQERAWSSPIWYRPAEQPS